MTEYGPEPNGNGRVFSEELIETMIARSNCPEGCLRVYDDEILERKN